MNVDQSANWEGRRGSEPRKNLLAMRFGKGTAQRAAQSALAGAALAAEVRSFTST
jgi:hypothetical protein